MRALIVGAGEAGRALARDLAHVPEFGLAPVGFLDDDPCKADELPAPLLGRLDALPEVCEAYDIDAVVLAIPSIDPAIYARLASAASSVGVTVRYLPTFLAALTRDVVGSDMQTLELGSLLGRSELHVASSQVREVYAGRTVLVTGAGGSIGSELCRQVMCLSPQRVVMLDHDESNLHRLQLEIHGEALLTSEDLVIADIRDADRVDQVFSDYQPDVVLHAAAHKHLPLLEQHPCEGVKSNVLGTDLLVRAAVEHGVERFVLVSTDKAADPTSVLGATKRLAELIVASQAGRGTAFGAVRFGNVLGSRGSLLSVLAEQLRTGRPVTVTHPDVTRFFMTISEAVGLVLEAGRMAESGETFVLDMGSPVRIVDLVETFAAKVHAPRVDIRFTGLRPGEKLDEALFGEQEQRIPTEHPRISMAGPVQPPVDFARRLRQLYAAARTNQTDEVRRLLAAALPDYRPDTRLMSPALAAPYPDGF
jgi:FlaA1/EpsC-like NDP-sugar epimerase